MVEKSALGPVAFVAGREDKGLSNEELDRCHALVTIPVNPEYRSLNLAQAVAILGYEVWMCRSGADQPLKRPRHVADPTTAEQLERLFEDWFRALTAIDFFKTRQPEYVMRSWREIVYRARLDGREAALVRAMGIEVQRCLERNGIPVAPRPPKGER